MLEVLFKITLLFFKCLFLRERETETETESERVRGRETGDIESEAGSSLWAVSTEHDLGFELMDREIMTWAEVGRLTG